MIVRGQDNYLFSTVQRWYTIQFQKGELTSSVDNIQSFKAVTNAPLVREYRSAPWCTDGSSAALNRTFCRNRLQWLPPHQAKLCQTFLIYWALWHGLFCL